MCRIKGMPSPREDTENEDLSRVLGLFMVGMDRHDALGEATFAAMETVISLRRAAAGCVGADHLELLREALGSARATVVAAGYALTASLDAVRAQRGSDDDVQVPRRRG
jgi:hypothetical protein